MTTQRRPGRPQSSSTITPGEQRVLRELRRGLPNRRIAERLGISIDGVKFHVSNMLGKLGLRNRRELAAWQDPGGYSMAKEEQAKLLEMSIDSIRVNLATYQRAVVLRVNPNPPKDTDGRREESGRGVRELQGK